MIFGLVFAWEFIIGGLLGSIVKTVVEGDGKFVLPKVYTVQINGNTQRVLSVGFVGNIMVGVIVAVIVDHSFLVSFFSSIAGPFLLEKFFKIKEDIKKGKLKVIR